jgi:NAD(P)-dependent dehydrogenase (short-subunit alcohol dehydrogenase family)
VKLEGQVAVITGAGTGIGRAAMVLFAQQGARVVGCGRTQANGDETMELVQAAGGEGRFVAADARRAEDTRRVIGAAVEAYGRLDILVNNASVGYSYPGTMAPVDATPEADWDDIVSINLKSVYLMSHAAIPEMRKAGGGAIVNVSSVLGIRGGRDAHAYAAAKGGTISLTRSMAVTYGPENIRVNCLAPGGTETPMLAPRMDDIRAMFADPATRTASTPLGRLGTPEEMAKAILYLASADGSYTNGAILVVDGGSTA